MRFSEIRRRFLQNRPAAAGLAFIALAVFVALFGYALAPDDTPDANQHLPEIALQAPGFRATLLPVQLGRQDAPGSWLHYLLGGRPAPQRWIPIAAGGARVQGDSIVFQRPDGRPDAIHLLAPLVPLDDSVRYDAASGQYAFRSLGRWQTMPRAEALARAQTAAAGRERLFPLGADQYGRCIYSRLLLGFRVSLTVGAVAVGIALLIGITLGVLGGYFGGRIDDVVMLLVNTVWSIPTLLLVFAVVLALGRGAGIIFLAVGLTLWVEVARVVRGQALVLKALPFVEAARSLGSSHGRIIWRHILPNLMGPVWVVTAGNFATAILIESGLSYLGFGVQPPMPSWGSMLYENYGYALSGRYFPALAPAAAIALTVLAFNLVGNGLRDALDVRR